jgi:hypothetical protein
MASVPIIGTRERPLGWEFYNGPSALDGTGIIGLLQPAPSSNRKLGLPWFQAWILVRRQDPAGAQASGADAAVCGSCVFRPRSRRLKRKLGQELPTSQPCYVVTVNGPGSMYRAWQAGRYDQFEEGSVRVGDADNLRMGAYGDPAAIPVEAWEPVVRLFPERNGRRRVIGYTQQWLTCPDWFRQHCMASVTSEGQAALASQLGWRCFRIRKRGERLLPREFECPASDEQGHRLTCDRCMACHGSRMDKTLQAASVSIIEH